MVQVALALLVVVTLLVLDMVDDMVKRKAVGKDVASEVGEPL